MRYIYVVACLIGFSLCKSVSEPVYKLIPKNYFITSAPIDNPSLSDYSCTQCSMQIEYVRNNNTFKDYFIISDQTFNLDELLVTERMEFYNIRYSGNEYLLISSPDFSSVGKAYSVNKNYYLFTIKNKKAVKLNKLIDSQIQKEEAFRVLSK